MDKNSLIKWALIAGAAYLLYRYAVAQGWLGAAPAAGQIPEGTAPGATTTPAPATTETTVAPSTTPAVDAISQSLVAAMQANGLDPAAQYGGYEWGWIWQRAALNNGKPFGPTEMGISDTDKAGLAEAAAAIRATYGSGMGKLLLMPASPAFASAWRM
jgi:hypothetical protein